MELDDQQTERLVLDLGLLSPETLAPYKLRCADAPPGTLFLFLVADGVIRKDLLAQLEQAQQPPTTQQLPAHGDPLGSPPSAGTGSSSGSAAPPPKLGSLGRAPATTLGLGRPSLQKEGLALGRPAPLRAGLAPPPAAPQAPPPATTNPSGLSAPALPRTLPPAVPASAPPRPALPLNLPRTLLPRAGAAPGLSPAAGQPSTAQPRPMRPLQGAPLAPASPSPSLPAPQPHPAAPAAPPAAAQAAGHPAAASPPAAPPSTDPAPPPQKQEEQAAHDEGHGSDKKEEQKVPEGWPGGLAPEDPDPQGIQALLKSARALQASDVHLSVGLPPMARVHGRLRPLQEGAPALTAADTERLIRMALAPQQWEHFQRTGDLDFCYYFQSGGRFRTNVLKQRNGSDLACRVISEQVMTLEALGLPESAKRLTEFAQGLVLITGPSGHGKTTTMYALVQMVNANRSDHIITVEDPIELVLAPQSCQVTQREVGPHTKSFATALRAALREDPDIIVIGELRDYETTSMAINAAETGHLVFSSLPTQDAAKTIDKLIDVFPPEEQTQIRLMVSESLRGIVSQQLIPRKDGQGRVAAVELLFNSVAVANIIRDANTPGLVNAMQLGKKLGMVLMDDSLMTLAEKEIIEGKEAYSRANNKLKFSKWAPKPEAAPAPKKEGA